MYRKSTTGLCDKATGRMKKYVQCNYFLAPKPTVSKQIKKSMHSTHMHYSNNIHALLNVFVLTRTLGLAAGRK